MSVVRVTENGFIVVRRDVVRVVRVRAAGPQGFAGTVSIGTITTGEPGTDAEVNNVGTDRAAVLDFVLPRGNDGATGPANTLVIGTVTAGAAAASITGSAPNQTLNLVLQQGPAGPVSSVSGTAPIQVVTGTTTPVVSISAATTSAAGSMSAADKTKLDNITGTNTGNETAATIGTLISGATAKSTPVDADSLGLSDSAASNALKKLTWANLKAGVFTAWGALIGAAAAKTTPVDADSFAMMDSAASNATKQITWSSIKATLKTYFDTLYIITAGTAVATTSGSAIDFTSIPSSVKRFVVTLFGVSSSGSDAPQLQLGTGGVPTTTGYKTESHYVGGSHLASTSSFFFGVNGGGAGNTYHGSITFTKHSGNTWVGSGNVGVLDGNTGVVAVGGSVALAGTLDMVRLLIGGGNTFDAGSVNILYES